MCNFAKWHITHTLKVVHEIKETIFFIMLIVTHFKINLLLNTYLMYLDAYRFAIVFKKFFFKNV